VSTTDPAQPSPALLDRVAVRGAGSAVMAMTLFVASEAVFFGAFFGIYASAYTQANVWPPGNVITPSLPLPTIATLVLLASGGSMALARRAARRDDYPRAALPWLAVTLACAVGFAVLVVAGYPGLRFGIGEGIYQSLFYTITAIALAHVAGGVVLLVLVLARARAGELALHREPLQAASIYWYFVVALGVVIYLLLYLAAAG
jgi:heme/copper-type cytochrome/quinol oxidase subunit 3